MNNDIRRKGERKTALLLSPFPLSPHCSLSIFNYSLIYHPPHKNPDTQLITSSSSQTQFLSSESHLGSNRNRLGLNHTFNSSTQHHFIHKVGHPQRAARLGERHGELVVRHAYALHAELRAERARPNRVLLPVLGEHPRRKRPMERNSKRDNSVSTGIKRLRKFVIFKQNVYNGKSACPL